MTSKTIYVGNLPLSVTEDELRDLFAPFGEVVSASLVSDQQTGRSRGFGFVQMAAAAADSAIEALDLTELGECTLRVNEARDRGARPPRRTW